jgi:sugar phosphate isomerase/epimerase
MPQRKIALKVDFQNHPWYNKIKNIKRRMSMKTSVSTFGAFTLLGIDGALKAISEAGFDAIDLGLDSLFPQKDTIDEAYAAYLLDETRIRETIDPLKEGLKKYGLSVGQAHAPNAYVARRISEAVESIIRSNKK